MKKILPISTLLFTALLLIGCGKSSTDNNVQAEYKDLSHKELKKLKTTTDSYEWTEKQKKENKRANWKDKAIK